MSFADFFSGLLATLFLLVGVVLFVEGWEREQSLQFHEKTQHQIDWEARHAADDAR